MALKVAVPAEMMGGEVDEGYGKVADAFRANFADGKEIGAAVAAYRDGVKVVDLWGGYRNGLTKSAWERDTMVNMFSTTKGITALTVPAAVSRGLLSYDAKVADYWPEFAQAGKERVTVRQLLAHQAGLSAVTPAPTLQDVADPARLAPMLAARIPRHHTWLVPVGADPPDRPGWTDIGTISVRRDRLAPGFRSAHRPARPGGS